MRAQIVQDKGAEQVDFQFLSGAEKAEMIESLRVLRQDGNYQSYRQLMRAAKEAYLNSCLGMNDPYMIVKNVGIAAGINFSLNQIDAILSTQTKKKEEPAE